MIPKLAVLSMLVLGACVAPAQQTPEAELLRIRVESPKPQSFDRLVMAAQPRADAQCGADGKVAKWAASTHVPGTSTTRISFICH